ncbi:NACHT domain-containing protein [Leptodesmis sichuanensis A121]|nr:NB-ARC domain-containing protein [Leptodesmis sichuanensis]UIE39640.1 NACHT domain-containing protein [Leptodesmis sichuanensis A121]
MDFEAALDVTEAILSRTLSDIEQLTLRGVWVGEEYDQITARATKLNGEPYSVGHIKNVAMTLYRQLSERLNKTVKKNTIKRILEQHHQQAKQSGEICAPLTSPLHLDLQEVPRVSAFYGRTEDLATLNNWVVQDRCQLVALVGMGGMGKTALAVKLIEQVQQKFDYVIWRSLSNAPSLAEILSDWINFLSNQTETQLPEGLDIRFARLRHYLSTQRCLLILDNLETIFDSGMATGTYRPGYESYGQLLKLIGEGIHQSCLLVTSREKPRELTRLAGVNSPVRSLLLKGLTPTEGRALLQDHECRCTDDSVWQAVVNHFAGNPLALKFVASGVEESLDGNLQALIRYLEQGQLPFSDIADLLDRQFERLTTPERHIVYWLCINREPISLSELEADMVSESIKRRLLNILTSLVRRCLVEQTEQGWFLQPVVMEYVTEKFITQICTEITDQELELFKTHALIKATAKDYVRQTQIRLILDAIVHQLIDQLGNQQSLEFYLNQILAQLRQKPELPPNYAAGNLLNLLCHLQSDLAGYDFSHLTVWQAYLQGARLQDVNFTGAQFAKTVFTQTFGNVLSVVFSSDGSRMATGNANGNIYVWRVDDGHLCLTLRGHQNWVRGISFSSDGNGLVSSSEDQTIKIWDLQAGTCIRTIQGHTSNLNSVTLSPDGTTIASASNDQTIRLWDSHTGRCLRILEGHQHWVLCTAFSPDGKRLVSSSGDQTIRIWDVATGACLRVLTGHESWVIPVGFSSGGDLIVSAGFDQTVRVWDVAAGKCLQVLRGHTGWIWCAMFSPDNRLIASTGVDQTIRIWDAETGACLYAIQGHTKQVWRAIFHPDGKRLASCAEDQTVRLWDISTRQCLRIVRGYTNWVRSVSFSRDGQLLLSAHQDSTVNVWDAQHYRWLYALKGHTDSVMDVAVSPDGQYLASAGEDRTVRVWLIAEQRCLHVLTGHTSGVWTIAFSPDSRLLVSAGCDLTLRVWDVQSAACLQVLKGHSDRILDLAFSPTSILVASASEDQTVKLWNPGTGECIREIVEATRVMSVAFSPDGKTLATGSLDTTVKLWDVESGEQLHILPGHGGWVMSLAFSPDGQTLISGSCDQTIKIWHLPSNQCINTLKQHQNWVWSIAYRSDGDMLASGSEDETIKIWNVRSGQCLATLRTRGPYDGMKIAETTGLSPAQKTTLNALGAIESVNLEQLQPDFKLNGANSKLHQLDH